MTDEFGEGLVELIGPIWTVDSEDNWRLTDTDGTEHGPFDALFVNLPAPQTADLLRETGVEVIDRLGDAAGAVAYRTVWTAVLGYYFEINPPTKSAPHHPHGSGRSSQPVRPHTAVSIL